MPSPAAATILVAASGSLALACLYAAWPWVMAALLSALFMLFVAARGAPAATLLLIIARPVVDTFVYLPIGPVTLGQVWGILLLLLLLYGLAVGQMAGPSLKRDAPLLIFVLLTLLALARNPNLIGMTDYSRFVTWLLLIPALGSASIKNPVSGATLLRCGRLLMAGSIGAAWCAWILNRYGLAYYAGELGTQGQGPHGLSLLVVLSLVFVATFPVYGTTRIVMFTIAGLSAVLGSFVRSTSIAGLAVSASALLILAPRSKFRWYVTLFICLGLLFLIALPYASMFIGRFSDLGLLGTADYSQAGSGRIAIWMTYLSTLQARGPVGWAFGLGAEGTRQSVESKLGMPFFAHSDPLEFLVAGGLPLLFSYLSVLLWLMRWPLAAARSIDPQVKKFGQLAVVVTLAYGFVSCLNGAFFYQASVALSLSLAYCRRAVSPSRSQPALLSR